RCANQTNHPCELIDSYISEDVVVMVPTATAPKQSRKLNLQEITSSEDLALLKAQDPFMYYSIPSVKEATLKGRDVDVSTLDHADAASSGTFHDGNVTRQTRLTFEFASHKG
ncbi:hypothetical protein ACHAXN_002219, partial [Cyclotella atomus]